MTVTKTTRRLGFIGATSMLGLLVAISPAKPIAPTPDTTLRPAVVEAAPVAPTVRRPVRSAPKIAIANSSAPACPQVRRKLWVEGEGWVIRPVGRC